ncbi:HTH-like domain-containing protein [Hymenobacter cellulosivorans]|uniref:HTH-like domain-containing protein n=1 Tax=Hymenobacter cellulosivorans TaxID=2932249 RepID=A0ABY4FJH1_9BACT|nr:hypothetical protein [Hymenobacter cellulosivorans]UOQ54611.1 hypothetical protein MUN80_07560 [Hymenobacter cellulosivorans]
MKHLFTQISLAIEQAALANQKVAMLHLQVLKHADELAAVSPKDFCEAVGLQDSYKAEYSKMLKLASVMKQENLKLA